MENKRKHTNGGHFEQIEMFLEGAIERQMVYNDSSINIIVKDAQIVHDDPMKIKEINKNYYSYSLPLSGSTSNALMQMDSSSLSIDDYKELLKIFKSL